MKFYGMKNGINQGFYLHQFEGAKEVSDDEWKHLLDKQSVGKVIRLDSDENVIPVEYALTDEETASYVRRKGNEVLQNTNQMKLLDF